MSKPTHCAGLRCPAQTRFSATWALCVWDQLRAWGGGPDCICLNLTLPASIMSSLSEDVKGSQHCTHRCPPCEMRLQVNREGRGGQTTILTTLFLPELRPGKVGFLSQQLRETPHRNKGLLCKGVRTALSPNSCGTAMTTNKAAAPSTSPLCQQWRGSPELSETSFTPSFIQQNNHGEHFQSTLCSGSRWLTQMFQRASVLRPRLPFGSLAWLIIRF